MKTVFLMVGFLCLQLAHAGQERGGGEPVAQAFVSTMKQVYLFLENNPRVLIRASRVDAKKYVKILQESLGQNVSASLVEVTVKKPRDRFGVQKAAVTTVEPLKIELHEDSWVQPRMIDREAVKKDQVILAAMELLVLVGLDSNRYELASKEIGERYLDVLASKEEDARKDPPMPAHLASLPTIVHGKEWRIFNFALMQALKNSKFKNCLIEPQASENSWAAQFIREGGASILYLAQDSEAWREISYVGEVKSVRVRYNASEWDKTWKGIGWDQPLQGVSSTTFHMSDDQTEVLSIDFEVWLIKNVTYGTPFRPIVKKRMGPIQK